jgi:hypothetical protein
VGEDAGVKKWIYLLATLIVFEAASAAFYLWTSGQSGFPLDDAWIHQTYARNLALRGEWSFVPGQPSAGSTAPLWSGLLAVGHLLGLGPYLWTYILGGLLLLAISLLGGWVFGIYQFSKAVWVPWVSVMLLFEWHLVWAAGSGMETLLLAFLALAVLGWLAYGLGSRFWNWLGLGLLIGLTTWVRPDGITLFGPALVVLLLSRNSRPGRIQAAIGLCLGFGLIFGPYLVFNRLLAGAWWPNTFYAKQAEYAVLQAGPLWLRYIRQWQPLLQGVGIVLLPGYFLSCWQATRRRNWGVLVAALWVAGYLGLYAWRLPVAYQHGRYLIPVLPVYTILGLAGLAGWFEARSRSFLRRVLSQSWVLAAGLVLVLYWAFGLFAYAGDVAFIESEMVSTAQWVEKHTQPGAKVAAHDIGALGYFAGRPLLDLAGLVSPEVIPFIRNETRLADFLQQQNADYLVTFPGWYPQLVRGLDPVFQTGGTFALKAGGENMKVYRWNRAP